MLTGCGPAPDRPSGNLGTVKPKSGDLIATFEIEGHGTIKAVLFPDIAPVGVENFQKLADQGFYNGLTIHRVVDQFMFQGGSANGNGTGGEAAVNGGSFGIETDDSARHFYGALCYANAAGQNSTQFYIVNANESIDIDDTIKQYNEVYDAYSAYAAAASSAYDKAVYEYYASEVKAALDKFSAIDQKVRALYKERGGTPSLDGGYTVFGQVYEGFDVIESISKVEVELVEGGVDNVPSKPVDTIFIKNVTVSKYE